VLAAASVDVETDSRVQAMIRDVFRDCTVFAIAHRLGTIIDYDTILVLDKGNVIEAGNPATVRATQARCLPGMFPACQRLAGLHQHHKQY